MNVVYEDSGKLLAGRLFSEADSSVQIELDTGKRIKVKSANVLMRFATPEPIAMLQGAQTTSEAIDLSLAWEFAPEDVFGFNSLAIEYFGRSCSAMDQVGMLLALHGAPHYFRRNGKGQFRKADAQTLALALAAIERKKQVAAQIETWTAELVGGICPTSVREQLFKILFKPDKNASEYKAVAAAARQAQVGVLPLLRESGAIASEYEFHWQRFLFEHFPKGVGFAQEPCKPFDLSELPVGSAQAFSIDDSQTTEIDDALSVSGLGTGLVTLGIHIAAPALGIAPGDAIDVQARNRLSTVYMPGNKITMLPDDLVNQFSLKAGQLCPTVSLYVSIDEASLQITSTESQVERTSISHNLRHDQLGEIVTPDWLAKPSGEATELFGLHRELAFLHRFALARKQQRELVRGKPENFNRPDFNFRLAQSTPDGIAGDEAVIISQRARGEPLDLIVAECMIVANHQWGAHLNDLGVPGIYRSQASLAPGIKVRMGTRAQPHAGIGVPCYAWSTSPLRRYTDLVNQWQIIACVKHGQTAALAAPFKPKDAQLLGIIGAFDATYASYNAFQTGMERYWTLQYLIQQKITSLTVSVIKDQPDVLVRASELPLVFKLPATRGLARGQQLRVGINGVDLLSLEVHTGAVEPISDANGSNEQDAADEDESTDLGDLAGGVVLAVELDEAGEASATTDAAQRVESTA